MNIRTPLLISLLLIAGMAAAGYWAYLQLPTHSMVTVHWDAHGTPNRIMPKEVALFLLPVTAALVTALMAALPSIEPRRANLIASRKLYQTGWIGALLVMALAQTAIVMTALHHVFNVRASIVTGVSLLLIAGGNYFGKSRANFFAGIRTPWTLSSDYSWEKTHRLGGRLFVAAGMTSLLVLATDGVFFGLLMLLGTLFASLIATTAMSYVYWKRDPDRNSTPAMAE